MTQLVWLVTGCSSGFGEAFVHAILARGDKVIATGRNAAKRLAHMKETGAAIIDLDVTVPQAELDARIQQAIKTYGRIDVLVNNAGYVEMGFIEDLTTSPAFSGKEDRQNRFHELHIPVSSLAGGGPYTVSKHGLAGFAATLNDEVSTLNIHATLFDIGYFRTAVVGENAKLTTTNIEDYKQMGAGLAESASRIHGNQPGDPKQGAERMIDVLKSEGMAKGKPIPRRVAIGEDALQLTRAYAKELLNACDEWEALSTSTDFEGPRQGFFAQ